MADLRVRLSNSVHQQVKTLAERDHIAVHQFMARAC